MADNKTSIIISAVDQTGAALKSAENGLASLGAQAGKVTGILSGFAALAGVTAFGGIIKGAIDAADGLDDLSQKSGATVEALSAMKGVAKIAGADMEQVGSGLAKLGKNMVEAANGSGDAEKVFKALGISVTDTSGKMKTTDQVMVEFAKGLQNVGSSTEKVAAAQIVLGKSGSQLLPFMNDLANVGELQVKVTAEQAAQAANLNDNLKRLESVHKSWANTVAMEALPVADLFVKALLDSATSANGTKKAVSDLAKDGSLREWAVGAARAAGFVVDAMDGVVRVVQGTGKTLGAVAAASIAIGSGEFKQASDIMGMLANDLDEIAQKPLFSALLEKQLATLGTEAPKAAAGTLSIASALSGTSDAAEKAAKALANLRISQMALITKEAVKELDALTKQYDEYYKALSEGSKALEDQAAALEREVEFYGLAESEIQKVIIARLEEARAMAEANGAYPEHLAYLDREIEARQRIATASSQKEYLDTNKKAAEQAAREWEKFSDDINRSLTDALFRAFESGGSFSENFAKTLSNTIKAALTKALIQAAVTTGSNALNGLLNAISGNGSANNGAGVNYFGLANNASSIYNLGAGLYGLTGAATGATSASLMYANAVGAVGGDSLGALIAANGGWSGVSTGAAAAGSTAAGSTATGSTAAGASGASMASAATGILAILAGMYMSGEAWQAGYKENGRWVKPDDPKTYELALRDVEYEINKSLFGKSFAESKFLAVLTGSSLQKQMTEFFQSKLFGSERMLGSGIRGTFSDAGFTDGQLGINMKKTGGLFSKSKTWTDWQDLPDSVDATLNGIYKATKTYYINIGSLLSDTSIADKLKSFTLIYQSAAKAGESTTVNFGALIDEALSSLSDSMGKYLLPSIESLTKTVESNGTQIAETWQQTFSRVLSEANAVTGVLTAMGRSLSEAFGANNADGVLRLSDSLVQLFGSIDNLQNGFNAYYENFYSAGEKTNQAWELIGRQFDALGIATPKTREAFRQLVEAQDLFTTSGQKTFAALIGLQGAFAALTPSTEEAAQAAAKAAADSARLVNDFFDTVQNNLSTLIQSIASERESVAVARSGILGVTPKTFEELQAAIVAAKVPMPSDAQVLAALSAKGLAQNNLTAAQTSAQNAQASQDATASAYRSAVAQAQNNFSATVNHYKSLAAWFQDVAVRFDGYQIRVNATGTNNDAFSYDAATNTLKPWNSTTDATQTGRSYRHFLSDAQRFKDYMYGNGTVAALEGGNAALAAAATAVTQAQAAYVSAMSAATAITTQAQTSAAEAAASLAIANENVKAAILAYGDAMTKYSGDAEKAVIALGKLREETVAYYQAQKELAGLMSNSAAALREAIRATRFGQLDARSALAQQQTDFSKNYSLALITEGAIKASYADKMSAALPGLSNALLEVSASRVEWSQSTARLFAQSEAIASQLEQSVASMDYEAESLTLLNSIDVTLAELDTNTAILKNAIDAGAGTTAAGLRAIVTQLGGTPAFATGGSFSGGWRIVGENGPELEATGPSRIFNAAQTAAIFSGGGGMGDIVAELRALRQENADLRAEVRAVAGHTYKTARQLEQVVGDGVIVRTETGAPLETTPA